MYAHSPIAQAMAAPPAPTPPRNMLARYPLISYFTLAYAGAWLIWLPLLLAQNGYSRVPLRLPLALFAAMGSFTGPTLAAFAMAGALEGRAGVRRLLRRYIHGRAGIQWYLLVLLLSPAIFLVGGYIAIGPAALDAFVQKLPLFINAYPILLVSQLFTGPLGEEPGWRGFALPRLQAGLGPVIGSLVLGSFWALWHAPLYLLPEVVGKNSGLLVLAAFASWVIPFTILITWVYNHTQGGLLLILLFHTAQNATIALVVLHALKIPADLFFQTKIFWLLAVVLILVTRGRLGYKTTSASQAGDTSPAIS
jgi:membrane protease YdiL (CAAX protease family)